MTFDQFDEMVMSSFDRPRGHRIGQHLFNRLYEIDPYSANKIRGGELDPFHCEDRNERLSKFLLYVFEELVTQ